MSLTLIIIALIVILFLAILTFKIGSLHRRENPSLPLLEFYSQQLTGFFKRKNLVGGGICFVHYVLLHIVVPLTGLAFLLRTDVNFLAIFAAIIASMQIMQRIYPAIPSDSPDEEL